MSIGKVPIFRRTELCNTGIANNNAGSVTRFCYFTKLQFYLGGRYIDTEVKVDTGSYYTIIGADAIKLTKERRKALPIEDTGRRLESASGHILNAKPIVVDEFRLTNELIFPQILIYISDDLKDKSVLGMDILTLFNFRYDRRDHTMWLYYEDDFLDRLKKRMFHHKKDYIDPGYIASLDIPESRIKQPGYEAD